MIEGVIRTFKGSWASGIATFVVATNDGNVHALHCDNGPMVRALDAAFGDVIAPGHRVNVAAIRGKRVRVYMDDLGLLIAAIEPLDGKGASR